MNRDSYARLYSTGHAYKGHTIVVPADIERRDGHQPCGFCGVRPDVPCRHKEGV